jgi:hypothetical protein
LKALFRKDRRSCGTGWPAPNYQRVRRTLDHDTFSSRADDLNPVRLIPIALKRKPLSAVCSSYNCSLAPILDCMAPSLLHPSTSRHLPNVIGVVGERAVDNSRWRRCTSGCYFRRNASTPAHLQGAVWLRNEKGLEEQSRNLSTRAARNRSIHLASLRSGWTDAVAAFPNSPLIISHAMTSTFRRQRRILMVIHRGSSWNTEASQRQLSSECRSAERPYPERH